MLSKYGRQLADGLTILRVLISAMLVLLGLWRGAEVLETVIALLMLAFFTDLIDGHLARMSPEKEPSWIGRHDPEADMAMSVGVSSYLTVSGFLAPTVGAVLIFVIVTLWLYRYQLAWPIYAIPYVILALVALQQAPFFGWLLIAYVLATMIIRIPRLLHEYLPDFVRALGQLRGRKD